MTERTSRFRFTRLIATASLVLLTASTATAHDGDHWPIAGDGLKVRWDGNLKNKFQFKSKKQVNINSVSIAEDPTVSGGFLWVRGTGAFSNETGALPLPAHRWAPIGKAEDPKGWKFKGGGSASSGIERVQIKTGKKGGSVKVKAKGFYFPFEVQSSLDPVEIVLTIGDFSFCAEYSTDRSAQFIRNEVKNGIGEIKAKGTFAPVECPAVCGNGVTEDGEECDDGNTVDADTCTNTCTGCDASEVEFASTFEGIQQIIFDDATYGCSNDACHGSATQGGLDLRDGNSHADLVNVDSVIQPTTVRVFPGDQDLSMLYLKIAEKTLGSPDAPGTAMPQGAATVTEDHLEALRLWIRGGAPESGVVDGTAELLGSCLPPATPLKMPQPEVPDPAEGTQFAMPGYPLLSQAEVEGCIATYYDVSATVPAGMRVACPNAFPGTNETGLHAGECFSYRENLLFQDPQSHHSIVTIYPGDYNWNDPGWGTWRCYLGPTPGAACDPSTADPCGSGGVCGSEFHNGVACLGGWGAPDFIQGTSIQISGAQESTADFSAPAGVYALMPLKGLIVWNSHSFNLTEEDMNMEGWINMGYTDTRTWPSQNLFDDTYIFTQNVPPFEQREYCATHTFPDGTNLYQLSSHTHEFGIRWRYYKAPQTPCSPGPSCNPGNLSDVFYESYDYSDPLYLNIDPPYVPPFRFSGSVADRTIKFCALYDNGFNDPATVKTQSGSPIPTGNLIIGGPCSDSETACMGGVNKGQLCFGDDANCPSSACDACPLKGGVTTKDEMFIALGAYYVDP